ncbi:MAG TPA: methylmalonyl Co-A mutase-associated GTPase MeaB [Blastocatellia bacterium]|jgi:LAO/AO transport system kinase|nr:methylmalonyl Co-A mutase-associated GTPase MeaB [Blastocatellia bacterium]
MSSQKSSAAEKILKGDKLSIARAITAVEDARPEGAALLKEIFPKTGKALVIGITGAPGAGKSTLVDRLAAFYRSQGERVGIIAVDPSSPFTGGAILGDRIRMQSMSMDPGIFIRSMAARGNLGGLARATVDAVAILDAGGYNKVIVETVGVGQDEVDIVKTADVTVVVLVPGMGDDIQAIKAGIMEIGDVFAINKADREGVLRTERELETLLSISDRPDGWTPPIIKTVALEDRGLDSLAGAIQSYADYISSHKNELDSRRASVAEHRIIEMLRDRLLRVALNKSVGKDELRQMAGAVAARSRDPYSIVDEIIERLGI